MKLGDVLNKSTKALLENEIENKDIDKKNKLKEPKTFEEQINILKERNMFIEDEEFAVKVLKSINYYRLTAYALQFKKENKYLNETSFNTVYRLYKFDNKLKHLLLEILESIEITTRTYLAYYLSITFGSEAYKNIGIYKDSSKYEGDENNRGLRDEIKKEIKKNSKEPFIIHHNKKYDGKFPMWVIVEIFSFGMLSKMYGNLKTNIQKEISRNCFGINYVLLASWLNNFAHVRNICAHYGRIYNKKMAMKAVIHKKYIKYKLDDDKIFVTILAIKELMINTIEWKCFFKELEILLKEYQDIVDLNLIGFPDNWSEILSKK